MGGSHIKSGLDPKFIENSKNIAFPGETYFDTFHKLKYLVQKSKNSISTVICGFGHNNICGLNDDKYVKEAMSIEYLERIYPIIPYKTLKHFDVNKKGYLKTIIRKMCLYPKTSHEAFIGNGFNGRKPALELSKVNERIKHHYYAQDTVRPVSERDIQYLDSLVSFTAKQNINLVVVNIPQHKEYYSAVPAPIKKRYQKIESRLKENNVRILDLLKLDLEDSEYSNHDHLSNKGAAIVSSIVSDSLNQWGL